MARKPRIHFEGANHHVYSRGNGGKDIFIDDEDKRFFLTLLIDLKQRLGLKCHAWCLMTNHFHLLIEVGKVAASRLMQSALSRYAQHFNYKYETYGHVFQGRPGMLLCRRDNYFRQLVRYIHLNPVAAGIVKTPDEWPWSSHRCFAWGIPDPLIDRDSTLGSFGTDIDAAAAEYRRFVEAGKPGELAPILIESPALIESPTEVADIDDLAQIVARDSKITLGQLRNSSHVRAITAVRHDFVIRAWRAGFASAEIGRFLGWGNSAVAQVLRRKV